MTNHLRVKILTSTLLATILGLTACSKPETDAAPTTVNTDAASEPEQSAAATASTEADPQEKLNAYIECSNGTISNLHKSFNRYALWVDNMDTGPTGSERVVHGIYDLNETGVKACTTDAANAAKMAPSLPELDKAAAEYVVAIKAYDDVSRKAAKYYDQGNYKDDDFASAKELHPLIVSTYNAADKASESFDAQLEVINSKIQNEQLLKLEQEEGRKFNYLSLATTLKAKAMVDYITQETFDPDKASALIEDYEKASNEFSAYIDTEAEDLPLSISIVVMPMEDLLVASKQRMRHVRDNNTFTDSEIGFMNNGSGWMVEGSTHKVIDYYNKFIESMNRLN